MPTLGRLPHAWVLDPPLLEPATDEMGVQPHVGRGGAIWYGCDQARLWGLVFVGSQSESATS